MYRPATVLGCWRALIAAGGRCRFTGDIQGKLMFDQQPMKMASAESLCDTETEPDFSILTVGDRRTTATAHPRDRRSPACRPSSPTATSAA